MRGDVMNVWNWIDNLARGLKKVATESQQNYQQVHAYINGHDQETLNQVTEIVHDELEKVKSDVTQAKQDAAQAVANAESAKVTIDTSNIHQIKKPSEYPEGFSYEQKTATAVGIDRTNYADDFKSGENGVLTTKAVTIDKKKYARQSFELLDNDYPLTLERNGSDSAWNDWHAVTNWN